MRVVAWYGRARGTRQPGAGHRKLGIGNRGHSRYFGGGVGEAVCRRGLYGDAFAHVAICSFKWPYAGFSSLINIIARRAHSCSLGRSLDPSRVRSSPCGSPFHLRRARQGFAG